MTLNSFFLSYNKKYGTKRRPFDKKVEDIKINDNIFLGNEQKFLNEIVENCHEKIQDCEVSFHLSKRSMYICCEMSIMTKTNANMLLDIVNFLMKQHFCSYGLSQLGWCAHYMLDRRSLDYYNSENVFRKTALTDFYWFNSSLNRFAKQKTINQTEICNCSHCLLPKD